jgi:dolichol-phosphate mannosyltransferase
MKLTAVIPVLDEQESLQGLYEELTAVMSPGGTSYEIIFVDDGSSDESWDVISEITAGDDRVRGIRFRRNFGKAAALHAGFRVARGDIVFTLDADLQDDPAEIPRFIEKIESGHVDVVSGWKRIRHDPWHKVLPSRVFNWLVSRLTGVKLHDHNCGFKCYRRDVVQELRLYGELHRFIPVLAASRGWLIGEIEVNHRPRQYGKSKYGVGRIAKGFLDLITVYLLTGFRQRPQHLLGMLGLLCFGVGMAALVFLTGWRILSHQVDWVGLPISLTEKASFFYAILLVLFGGQLISMGILAEMLTANTSRPEDAYSIMEDTDDDVPGD